jgi:hypothetical protein
MREKPRAGAAALPMIKENRIRCSGNGDIEIGIRQDDRRRLATQFPFLGRTPKMLIDGRMVGAVSGETFEVVNPATGAVIASRRVPQSRIEFERVHLLSSPAAWTSTLAWGHAPCQHRYI